MSQDMNAVLYGLRRIVAHARQAQLQPILAKDQAWEIEQLAVELLEGAGWSPDFPEAWMRRWFPKPGQARDYAASVGAPDATIETVRFGNGSVKYSPILPPDIERRLEAEGARTHRARWG